MVSPGGSFLSSSPSGFDVVGGRTAPALHAFACRERGWLGGLGGWFWGVGRGGVTFVFEQHLVYHQVQASVLVWVGEEEEEEEEEVVEEMSVYVDSQRIPLPTHPPTTTTSASIHLPTHPPTHSPQPAGPFRRVPKQLCPQPFDQRFSPTHPLRAT